MSAAQIAADPQTAGGSINGMPVLPFVRAVQLHLDRHSRLADVLESVPKLAPPEPAVCVCFGPPVRGCPIHDPEGT